MAAKLREGFTTGSAATGAALAALNLLCSGYAPDHVDVPLPPFDAQPVPERPAKPAADVDAEQTVSARANTDASHHIAQEAKEEILAHPAPTERTAQKPAPPAQALRPRGWLRLAVAACGPGPAPELAAFAGFSASLPPDAAGADATRAPLRLAHASIRKDGGDDPDATSGALVTATVIMEGIMEGPWQTDRPAPAPAGIAHGSPCPAQKPSAAPAPMARVAPSTSTDLRITIEGGPGVGRVTLPGLPVPVGEAAINPVPRQQIAFALRHAVATAMPPCPPLRVIISVPEGERLARQTFNPRLGIVGGISILGTQGTVRPYSHKAWKATIEQGLAVAAATGCRSIALTTGRRSERLLMERYPHMPEQCFIQVADFAAFSLHAAGTGRFDNLVWGCFFGKLVKLAQGHAYTHARHADLDMAGLARVCEQYGACCAEQVKNCVTAAHALELLLQDKAGTDVIRQVAVKAAAVAAKFAGRPVRLHLFHTDGRELLAL
ncbi:cobalt-precorrin-5B (C(1))-methyltransferase CbiD [Desulfovibrio sp.]|uniref:cobalt-precorrin-5B (C(1))-methyltransferase CbiD n=1 Tax=Desulfovibrio sp. TaxID=885 RepID=UPI0025C1D856|nr:cobalt-precorrin-5B (C(1))-methyltransferase CbiD [Desulfovibrio sp.]